jgi:hypothetical protein
VPEQKPEVEDCGREATKLVGLHLDAELSQHAIKGVDRIILLGEVTAVISRQEGNVLVNSGATVSIGKRHVGCLVTRRVALILNGGKHVEDDVLPPYVLVAAVEYPVLCEDDAPNGEHLFLKTVDLNVKIVT